MALPSSFPSHVPHLTPPSYLSTAPEFPSSQGLGCFAHRCCLSKLDLVPQEFLSKAEGQHRAWKVTEEQVSGGQSQLCWSGSTGGIPQGLVLILTIISMFVHGFDSKIRAVAQKQGSQDLLVVRMVLE